MFRKIGKVYTRNRITFNDFIMVSIALAIAILYATMIVSALLTWLSR